MANVERSKIETYEYILRLNVPEAAALLLVMSEHRKSAGGGCEPEIPGIHDALRKAMES